MDALTCSETTWREQPAWLIAGPGLEVVVTVTGAQLACLRLPGETLNPLWQPPWPACTPARALDDPSRYGGPVDAPLLANIVGHNPCIDRFGAPWPGERKPPHGEAGVLPWTREQTGWNAIELRVHLPEAGLDIIRTLRITGQQLELTTTIRHGSDGPRPIEWAEHATLGDPFLDGAAITAGIDTAIIWPGEPGPAWRFPAAGPLAEIDCAAALAMPPADQAQVCGDIIACRVVEGWWRATRVDLKRELEYRWDPKAFPWLCLWTEHRSRTFAPWNGLTRSRGLEISTKPFPEGKPPARRAKTFLRRPTTCMVPAGEGLTRALSIIWRPTV